MVKENFRLATCGNSLVRDNDDVDPIRDGLYTTATFANHIQNNFQFSVGHRQAATNVALTLVGWSKAPFGRVISKSMIGQK